MSFQHKYKDKCDPRRQHTSSLPNSSRGDIKNDEITLDEQEMLNLMNHVTRTIYPYVCMLGREGDCMIKTAASSS